MSTDTYARKVRDMAVLARIGGNEYRLKHASVQHTQPGVFQDPVRMARMDREVEATTSHLFHRQAWRKYSYWHGTGRDNPARCWGSEIIGSAPPDPTRVSLPEAAFDWPVYVWGIGRAMALNHWPQSAIRVTERKSARV